MADNKLAAGPRPTGLQRASTASLTPDQQKIAAALAATAIYRGGEASETYLRMMSVRLSRERVESVLRALESIGNTEPAPGEPTLPSVPRILAEMRKQDHPHKHLRAIVTRLAKAFGKDVDEEFLMIYQDTAGHRTDEDLDRAYKTLRESDDLKYMPTSGQFLAACGIPRVYRDGRKPE